MTERPDLDFGAPDTPAPCGSAPERVDELARLLRDSIRDVGPGEVCQRLEIDTDTLLRALVDLRCRVDDFIPANGFPRATKGRFEHLFTRLTERSPDVTEPVQQLVSDALDGKVDDRVGALLFDGLAELYHLDHRSTAALRTVDGEVEANLEVLRKNALVALSRRARLRVIPADRVEDFAEAWSTHIAPSAVRWYERAYPPPLDPHEWAGRPTAERVAAWVASDDPERYRGFLGKQPPRDMVAETLANAHDIGIDALLPFARWLRTVASGKRWRAVGRLLVDALD